MNKIRILSALMALLLCLSMLLTACGNKDKDKESDAQGETEATGEASGENENESEKNEGEQNADKTPTKPQEPTTVKIADIMNKNWTAKKSGTLSAIAQAYKGVYNAKSTPYFLITTENPNKTEEKPNGDETKKITRVYNLETDKLLAEVNDNMTTNPLSLNGDSITSYIDNYVNIISDKYFAILEIARGSNASNYTSSSYFGCPLYSFRDNNNNRSSYVVYTLEIYNTEGTVVKTVSHDELEKLLSESIYRFDDIYSRLIKQYKHESEQVYSRQVADLIVSGNKVYRVVKDSDPVLVKDFGLSPAPYFNELDFKKFGENYLYQDVDNTYAVYDKDLNETFRYIVPGYAYGTSVNLLANGNLLVQYSVVLADEATEFDYITSDARCDLVTLLINKDGTTELKDVDYKIISVKPSAADADGQKQYADTVENLAFICLIDSSKMFDLVNNRKLVTLSNDCKTLAYVEAGEKISEFPTWINNDYFTATAIDGTAALYNENGEKTVNLTSGSTIIFVGGYAVVNGDGIYNMKNEKVYDLKANKATSCDVIGDSVIITTKNDFNEIKVFRFTDGTATEIVDYHNINTQGRYYVTKTYKELDKDDNKVYTYKFFGADGKELLSIDSAENVSFSVAHTMDGGFVASYDGKLYKLTLTK